MWYPKHRGDIHPKHRGAGYQRKLLQHVARGRTLWLVGQHLKHECQYLHEWKQPHEWKQLHKWQVGHPARLVGVGVGVNADVGRLPHGHAPRQSAAYTYHTATQRAIAVRRSRVCNRQLVWWNRQRIWRRPLLDALLVHADGLGLDAIWVAACAAGAGWGAIPVSTVESAEWQCTSAAYSVAEEQFVAADVACLLA